MKASIPEAVAPACVPATEEVTWVSKAALPSLLLLFLGLELALPLRTAIKIGGDEGFELAKAVLSLRGYKLYSQVWNDQPPLHTFLITRILECFPGSPMGPRLLTVALSTLLLASVFLIIRRVSGLMAATIGTVLLLASPVFVGLSASTMLEIPALAPAVGALCLLVLVRTPGQSRAIFGAAPVVLAGVLFGIGLLMKLVPIVLLPLVPIIIWLRDVEGPRKDRRFRAWLAHVAVFLTALVFTFFFLDLCIDRGAYVRTFKQSWASHFGGVKSFEYGSPQEHGFDWTVLLKNWEATLPAILGFILSIRSSRRDHLRLLPPVWLAISLIVFTVHKPWWAYYYVHLAIPICWCAAIGMELLIRDILRRRAARPAGDAKRAQPLRLWLRSVGVAAMSLYVVASLTWAGWRCFSQAAMIRNSSQTHNTLVLAEIARYKPFTSWLYADDPIFSFHANIPMPPDLAVVMLKRLWSGEMTNARLVSELEVYRPGVILLANDTRVVPFQTMLESDYRLVYMDRQYRLYAHASIAKRPRF